MNGGGDLNLACATALVDELVAAGMREACVSPGSRSTSIALALWRDERVRVHVHLDERSGGFFALGLAKASGRPVAVACTSGTAAAELLPAVVEASRSRLPLVLLTADRPPRLRDTGANQTIDQVELYGGFAAGYVEPSVPSEPADVEAWRGAGRDAGRTALGAGATVGLLPGPVQMNCPFEEPLVPEGGAPAPARGEARELPEAVSVPMDPAAADRLAEAIDGRRGVLVAGPDQAGAPATGLLDLAERLGWPVVAEPLSGLRLPGRALATGQSLLASAPFVERMRPEIVVQAGATPTTRTTQSFVASADLLVVADRLHPDPDPEGRADLRIRHTPRELVASLADRELTPAPAAWHAGWQEADDGARRALEGALDTAGGSSELRLARDLARTIPDGGTLLVGNSMPVRDLDIAMAPRAGLRVLANRGASGIDGLVSTALGIAATSDEPTFALLGDLSFLHDAGALLWAARTAGEPPPDLTIVVPNNDGGAIFSYTGQGSLPELAPLFTTPHGLDLGALCAAARLAHRRITRLEQLDEALARTGDPGIRVAEITIDAEANREHHRRAQEAVDAALA